MNAPGLTFPYGSARCVQWPPHKEGTCDYESPQCSKECTLRPYPFQQRSFERFDMEGVESLAGALLHEAGAGVLVWFSASGDCPKRMTNKVLEIMRELSRRGLHQSGFTRNPWLWKGALGVTNMTMVLTVEERARVARLSNYGPVAIPVYREGRVEITGPRALVVLCGGGFTCGEGFVEESNVYEEDCGSCWKGERGCFAA